MVVNMKGFVKTLFTDPAYENAAVMTFLFILENVL